MTGQQRDQWYRRRDTGWIGALSFGLFVLAVGFVWILTPNFYNEVVAFANDFELKNVTQHMSLPAPRSNHPVLYTALMQLCIAIGIIQIVILSLRFAFHESLDKKADTIGGLGFWFGAAFFLNMLANETLSWFGFLASVIICLGLLVMLSNIVKLFR
jgi:hypothetical protein